MVGRMFKFSRAALLVGLLATACAGQRAGLVDTAVMPQGTFAGTDVDRDALYEASQALGLDAPRPATIQDLARGMADVDYIAGAYNTHARWIGIDGSAQEGMLIARREVRDSIGIPQATSSQAVVNALIAVSRADTAPAMQVALANPVFTLGPQETEARLRNLPPLFSTPYAIARLNRAVMEPNGDSCSQRFC